MRRLKQALMRSRGNKLRQKREREEKRAKEAQKKRKRNATFINHSFCVKTHNLLQIMVHMLKLNTKDHLNKQQPTQPPGKFIIVVEVSVIDDDHACVGCNDKFIVPIVLFYPCHSPVNKEFSNMTPIINKKHCTF